MRVGLGSSLIASAVFFMVFGQALAVDQWPDTGQTDCYNNAGAVISCDSDQYPGQDGSHDGPARDTVNNGDGTVSDNVTGLLWQQDGSNSGERNLTAAGVYLDGLSLLLPSCTNWGLPTAQELSSLVDAGYTYRGLDDQTYGDFTLAEDYNPYYWTQTNDPADGAGTDDRMLVRFRHGTVSGSYNGGDSVTAAHVLAVCQD